MKPDGLKADAAIPSRAGQRLKPQDFSNFTARLKQAAEKVSKGSVFVAQPLLAVWFSDLSRIREAIHRENHTAKSGCATFSAACESRALQRLGSRDIGRGACGIQSCGGNFK